MALELKPTPKLKGQAAEQFVKRAKDREAGLSHEELRETQQRLRDSLKFFSQQDKKPSVG